MKVVRIQTGHYGRTTGATGGYNADLDLAEKDMNHDLTNEVVAILDADPWLSSVIDWEFVGPDDKLGAPCDLFVSVHHDANNSKTAARPSVGYPVASADHVRPVVDFWKELYGNIDGALAFRSDNYTSALRLYYAWKSAYSGAAPIKLLFEMEFMTNDERALWAIEHRRQLANNIILTALFAFGIERPSPPPTPSTKAPINDLEARLKSLEFKVNRAATINARQARYINGLQTRVTALEQR